MNIHECVKQARWNNHQAIAYKDLGEKRVANGYFRKRNILMEKARSIRDLNTLMDH